MIIDRGRDWPYLRQQHGRIGEYKNDFAAWRRAYRASLDHIYGGMRPYLPERLHRVLDIGGGFSGISVLLDRHHGPFDLTIIDSLESPARRGKFYNHADRGKAFLRANGFRGDIQYIAPDNAALSQLLPFDLICSFAAWPFHVPYEEYGKYLRNWGDKSTIIILDVRKRWEKSVALQASGIIEEREKYRRIVYALA